MTWFNFYSTSALTTSIKPPVRRLIVFPNINDNIKTGDWINVSLEEYIIGKVYSFSNGAITQSFDQDSFLVLYETLQEKTPTYSYLDENNHLYFKSVSDVNLGQKPAGLYYLYYHSDNIQFIDKIGLNYVSTDVNSGTNYMGSITENGIKYVDYYSHLVTRPSTNVRISQIGYLGDPSIWINGSTEFPGAKIVGSFDGPKLKIFADKGPDKGKIKIRIIKTSLSRTGQSIVKIEPSIDMYSQSVISNAEIFSFDTKLNPEVETQDRYSTFSFDIELLQEKNISSSASGINLIGYAFGKNYNLLLGEEEIEPSITFTSTGVIR
jgi:hypothetical protein